MAEDGEAEFDDGTEGEADVCADLGVDDVEGVAVGCYWLVVVNGSLTSCWDRDTQSTAYSQHIREAPADNWNNGGYLVRQFFQRLQMFENKGLPHRYNDADVWIYIDLVASIKRIWLVELAALDIFTKADKL